MYRYIIFFLILSVSAFSADSRVERWNQRIEKFRKIRIEAESGKADKQIIEDLAVSEIRSSEEFLSLLGRYKSDDGSLKSETRKYPLSEIEKKVRELILPAVSLYYMTDLYKAADDNRLKESIAKKITLYAAEQFGDAVKISQTEGLAMAGHYILERGMAEFETELASIESEILSKTVYELSRSDYNSNDPDLAKIIIKQIENHLTGKKFSDDVVFNRKYLSAVPQWRFINEDFSRVSERKKAVMNFILSRNTYLIDTDLIKDINSGEKEIFDKAKEKISDMIQNTIPGNGSTGNSPLYEIPDLKKLGIAVDEIDRYRKTLMQNIKGNENSETISRLKNNNTGIALRGISRIEARFSSEESRIERLKKNKGDIIIYNEEVFKTSRNHFRSLREEILKYADFSAEFVEALYSSGKIDPSKYLDSHRYRSERYLLYISFSEKLTSNILNLGNSGYEKFMSQYKGSIIHVFASDKSFLKQATVPRDTRETFSKEHVKLYAEINADFRTRAAQLISAVRKNYDECSARFARNASQKKESSANSENQIGQNETDRLFSFAKKCSELIGSLNYSETALKKYQSEYIRIRDELKKGNRIAEYENRETLDSFFSSIPDFNPEIIEKETATRELLAREGMESLSSSITIVQYYKKKGLPVKISPSEEEITRMKQIFRKTPEVIVSSWRMNGRNFRQVDMNVAAELKKLVNTNAWNSGSDRVSSEIFSIETSGLNISFSPPAGWKKTVEDAANPVKKIIFESPDMKGFIEITSIKDNNTSLQSLAGEWPKKSGFSMTEKTYGKKDSCDFIRSTAKNRYDGILESYMLSKNGYIIILSGKTGGDRHKQMTRTLAEIFKHIRINES